MEMQVLNASARRSSDIVPNIVASGTINLVENIKAKINRFVERRSFGLVKFPHIADMPLREYDEMAGIVGIEVQGRHDQFVFVNRQSFHIIGAVANETKNAAMRFFPFQIANLVEIEKVLHRSSYPVRDLCGIIVI